MPHVVVEQAGPLEVVFAGLDPFVVADGNLLRISDVFPNRRGTIMLLEAVVVDKPRPQTFFIQLSQKDQAVTVRLLPATDPEEKTPAVKRLMAVVARRLPSLPWEAIYTSPVLLTRQTAAPLSALTGMKATVEEGLTEISYAEWEGLEQADVKVRWPGGLRILGSGRGEPGHAWRRNGLPRRRARDGGGRTDRPATRAATS